jgi:hypothetical protein
LAGSPAVDPEAVEEVGDRQSRELRAPRLSV